MQSRHAKKAVLISLATLASPVFAQNSVTLYGIVDDSISYQSSQTSLGSNKGGRSNIKMLSGIWAGSRFGLKGSEDLGGAPRPSSSWSRVLTRRRVVSNTRTRCSAGRHG